MPALQIWTARVSYGGPDRLDITRKSAGAWGIHFAPTWDLLAGALEARSRARALRMGDHVAAAEALERAAWETYRPAFLEEMRRSYRAKRYAWDRILSRESVTLVCYCTDAARCHRTLFADIFVRLGAEYLGERRAAPRDMKKSTAPAR